MLSAAGNFTLTAATLDNTSGRVQGGQNLTLQLSGALANQAGLVTTRNLLTLNAATVDNRNTRANALQGLQAGQLQVQAQALDNRQGQVISDGAGTVQLSAALDNSGGQISSGSSLDMRADAVTNTAGLLRSGGNQRLDARALSGDGQLQSQGDLSLTLREGLTNTGELSANGTLSIHTMAIWPTRACCGPVISTWQRAISTTPPTARSPARGSPTWSATASCSTVA